MKPWASGIESDSLQQDVYSIIARVVEYAVHAILYKDAEGLLWILESIFSLVHMKMKNAEDIHNKLEAVKTKMYSLDEVNDEFAESEIFDDLITVWKELTTELDREGILFRIKTDPNTMVTR